MNQHILPITNEHQTLLGILRSRAQHQPNQRAYTFLVDGECEEIHLTYAELDQQARAIAAHLQQMGITSEAGTHPAERALLLYPPGLDFIAAFFGCLYAGVIAVPSYPPRRKRANPRLEAIIKDAQPALLLSDTTIRADVMQYPKAALMDLEWLVTDHISNKSAAAQAALWQEPTLSTDSLAFLQYTSGSTSTPKGVMLTHGNLLHNLAIIQQGFEVTPNSVGLIWLPPYHDMGLIGGILEPLYVGMQVVLMSPIAFLQKPARWLQAISHYQATNSGGPNFAYDLCVEKMTPQERGTLDLSSWKVAFNGAEPIRNETLERFVRAFEPCGFRREAFYPCYGLAEGTLIVSGGLKSAQPIVYQVDSPALLENKVVESDDGTTIVGCGESKLGQKIVIVDPESHIPCPDGQVGEIWLKGPSVAKGYWNRPEETKRTFRRGGSRTAPTLATPPLELGANKNKRGGSEGPFLRTGDLGFLKASSERRRTDGELFVTGRIKDLMIIRGRNHYPQDIELTAQESHPALQPHCGAAFSVEIEGQERVVIVFEFKRRQRRANVEEVADAIRAAVAQQHELDVYAVVLIRPARIPKTTSGKIQRYLCRKGFLEGTLPVIGSSIREVKPVGLEPLKAVNGTVGERAKSRGTVAIPLATESVRQEMPFSLFFFSANEAEFTQGKYKLLIEASKFADQHDFSAVWVPERHFHAFGGLYPNPSTLAAALAMVTERIRLRAGSVVLPLHHPIRVAEEWAVVDNLSEGRVDLSFATGWNPKDFMLSPETYQQRLKVTYSAIETVQKLWKGEAVSFPNGVGPAGEARIYPLPQQKELTVWLTCSGGSERFIDAGRFGYNVLTALLFQSVDELAEKIALYRDTRAKYGHDPETGHVTVMLHTYIGQNMEDVRNNVRAPFTNYLKSSVNLWRQKAKPLNELSEQERQKVLDYAFERYYQTSALFGTPTSCMQMVQRLKEIGVDEIACLIDFGVDSKTVLAHLPTLNELRKRANAQNRQTQTALKNAHKQIDKHSLHHWLRDMLIKDVAFLLRITPEQVPLDKTFHSLGLDSLKAVELMGAFGEKFDISLPATLLFEFLTVTDLTEHLVDVYGTKLREYMPANEMKQTTASEARSISPSFPSNQKSVASTNDFYSEDVNDQELAALSEAEIAHLLASELGVG